MKAITFLPLLVIHATILNTNVQAQVTHSSYEGGQDADEHLHQNQIPPPSRQPSEDQIKEALGELIDNEIDQDKDNALDSKELKRWLEKNHHKILDDNIDRQWNFYQPSVQEIHSWEGYEPLYLEVLHWTEFDKATYSPADLDPSSPHYEITVTARKRSEKRWALADKNTDTVLTKAEFKDFTYPEESERIRDVLIDEAIEDMDKNKDELVTLDEFVAHLTEVTDENERQEPDWLQVRIEERCSKQNGRELLSPFAR